MVFFAPRTFAFRGPPVAAVFRKAAEEVRRVGAGADAPSTLTRGEDVLAIPLPLAEFKNGEGVLPTTGVPVREMGGVGRLIAGLSHEEKKSSSGSPAGVEVPSVEVLLITSVMTTSEGYLYRCKHYRQAGQAIEFILLSISCCPVLQLRFVFGGRVRGVLGGRVLALQSCATAVGLEVLGRRVVSSNLHYAQLIPLPF